jgi:hypothetical protein
MVGSGVVGIFLMCWFRVVSGSQATLKYFQVRVADHTSGFRRIGLPSLLDE